MEIPSITDSQLKLILTTCNNPDTSVFSQTSAIDADPLAFKAVLGQAQKDVEHLVSLKLLKEITADHQEQVDKTNAESGRQWCIFEITALCRALFQAYGSPRIN